MIHMKQSQSQFMGGVYWGHAFRAQLISTIPAMPVVISRRFVGVTGRTKVVRTPHWLSGFVTSPAVAVPKVISSTDDRAAENIVD